MSARQYSDVAAEIGVDYDRLVLYLTQDDALNIYKALSGVRFNDGRVEHLTRMIERFYPETFETELTEPWEWEND